ncbi:hypothetical protein [Anaerotignum sp.]|nr:hypothetical protein [Anaerotignum sp.]MBQ7758922.1 hypothetical protein [Anaerotignum sp.]
MTDWYENQEEQKEEKEKKYVTRKEFRICFVILLAAIGFATFAINDSIEQARNDVKTQVYRTEEHISSIVNNIPRNIEQGIEEANNPLRESSMEIIDVDEKAKTATIRMTAAPKEYVNGMTVKFMVSCDGAEKMEVSAAAGNDRVFTAEMEVPFCGVASATVHMKKGGTEYIQSMTGVNVESMVLPYFSGNRGGSVTWQASQDYVTFDGDIWVDVNCPEWILNLDKGASFDLKNEKMEVYVDGKLHKTLPVEIAHEDAYTTSYLAYINGENKIKLKNGKEIEFIFKAEDNNGMKYSYLVDKGAWDQNGGYENDAIWNMPDADRLKIE